jgi:uncharacterized protein YkwD
VPPPTSDNQGATQTASIFRRAIAAAAVAVGLTAPAAHAGENLTPIEETFLRAVNEARTTRGAPPVQVDAELERAARSHSTDMVARNYFAHGDFAGRLWRFGATGKRVGENLGWARSPHAAVVVVVGKWLQSPSHRAVLLRHGFRRIGVGVAVGRFAGYAGVVVVTTDFEGR